MDNNIFIERAKKIVADYNNTKVKDLIEDDRTGWCGNLDDFKIDVNQVYVVWLCKILQNNKALLATTLKDNMYYEVTYNGNKNEFYVDCYKKEHNYCQSEI